MNYTVVVNYNTTKLSSESLLRRQMALSVQISRELLLDWRRGGCPQNSGGREVCAAKVKGGLRHPSSISFLVFDNSLRLACRL
jgi:hypothetical protein